MNDTPTPAEEEDDGLDWLRQIRRDLLAEAGNDIAEYTRRLRERERTSGRRYLPPPPLPPDFEERVARVMAMAPRALEDDSAKVAEQPPGKP